jgi:hypothetical protein
MANIEFDLIQKFLFINSDKIIKKIKDDVALKPIPRDTSALIKTDASSLNTREACDLIIHQHELSAGVCAPSAASAKELFQDYQKPNYAIEEGYSIDHNIIFTKTTAGIARKYAFNIEEINNQQASYFNSLGPSTGVPKFLFHKINIVNKSKDAFTSKSNFQVTLHIAFTYFDDLKEEVITGKSISDSSTDTIALINLLYPYYSSSPNATGKPSNLEQSIKSGNGLILNQVLTMDPPIKKTRDPKDTTVTQTDFFVNTRKALGEKNQIHKNYHLTYHKHSINLFKSNNSPVLADFDSELIIDFIAYEADTNPSSIKDQEVPSIKSNVYSLLADLRAGSAIGGAFYRNSYNDSAAANKRVSEIFSESLKKYKEDINKLENAISCKKINKGIPDDINQFIPDASKKTREDFEKEARKKIEEIQTSMSTLKEQFNINLFRYIINQLDVYNVSVKKADLAAYLGANNGEQFLKTFGGAAEISFVAGAALVTFGVVTGGVGFAIAAGAALAAGGISAALAEGQAVARGIGQLRDRFELDDLRKTRREDYFKSFNAPNFRASSSSGTDAIKKRDETRKRLEETKKRRDRLAATGGAGAAEEVGQLAGEIRDLESEEANISAAISLGAEESEKKINAETVSKTVEAAKQISFEGSESEILDVEFILFGQILELLPLVDSYLLFGGKTVVSDAQINSNFLNYYYTPIHLTKFLDFLNNNIIKRDNFNYSSEVFIRDIVENLLRQATQIDGVALSILKELIPTHINMTTILTDDSEGETTNFIQKVQRESIIGAGFDKMKASLIKAKNLSPAARTRKLRKIYAITADEDIKYYNFYKDFEVWHSIFYPRSSVTSQNFQEWIIEKKSIPCLIIKAVDLYGTILKNTKNVTFARKDNQNLVTGQTLDNSSLLRLPYSFDGVFKSYIYFFVDVGSFLFIAPPDKRNGTIDITNTFGFSGLYMIKNSAFEYNFQKQQPDGSITTGNEAAKCDLSGLLISYGDGLAPGVATGETAAKEPLCPDPKPTSSEPAKKS